MFGGRPPTPNPVIELLPTVGSPPALEGLLELLALPRPPNSVTGVSKESSDVVVPRLAPRLRDRVLFDALKSDPKEEAGARRPLRVVGVLGVVVVGLAVSGL